MKRILLLFFIVLFLGACSTPAPARFVDTNEIPLNQTHKKELGESIILYQQGFYVPAIVITKGSNVNSVSIKNEIKPGETYGLSFKTGKYDVYTPYVIAIDGKNTFNYAIKVNPKNNNAQFYHTDGMTWLTYEFNKPVEFTTSEVFDPTKKYFRQELVYNGKSGNSIKFTYREYVDNLARPAFTQEAQYDLSESNTIGFKGARIEVIKATNTNIEYKILSSFKA
jgi:hypothetical protein